MANGRKEQQVKLTAEVVDGEVNMWIMRMGCSETGRKELVIVMTVESGSHDA